MVKRDLRFEVEVRASDFIELSQRNHLQSAFIQIWIDKSSIIDSLMVQDLSKTTVVKAMLISEDTRSYKERKSYMLSEFDFDHAIRLRLFTERDVVQILFIDGPEEM